MRKLAITTAAALTALTAVCASGAWVFEGEWGGTGPAPGRFRDPSELDLGNGTAVAPVSLGRIRALFR